MTLVKIQVGGSSTRESFYFRVSLSPPLLLITPPLLHTQQTQLRAVRCSPDMAELYWSLLRGVISNVSLGWLQSNEAN
jgi:hypothetical protein